MPTKLLYRADNLMKISYAICTSNEVDYIESTINQILDHVSKNDRDDLEYEVVVLDDYSDDLSVVEYFESIGDQIRFFQRKFEGNFADHKNALIEKCTGDWIINLDADESISEEFALTIPHILEGVGADVDGLWLPRVNTVNGLTDEHIKRWGWRTTQLMIAPPDLTVTAIQWPDWQLRIFRNLPNIRWVGRVHERISGARVLGKLPEDIFCAIAHHKTIDRQEKQNELYSKIG